MNITFYGAAGNVTGSKHLFEYGDKRILLDCGTFQGLPDIRERNRSLPFPPDSIDAVVLSHAHLDHSGMLPLLVKRGFKGPIFSTPATRDVVEMMLLDAASIETQDAEYRNKHHIGPAEDRVPLFTEEDIPPLMKQFKAVPYNRNGGGWQEVVPGCKVTFYDAGHILGSAVSVLEYETPEGVKRLAYSGDVGATGTPLLHDPEVPKESIDTLILESTYGNRTHQGLEDSIERLANTIVDVCNRGGKIIVPAFSLGRTQVLVYVIHKLTDEGKIPRFPIYVDSPLASRITEIYKNHREDYDDESRADFEGADHRPLMFSNLTYVQSVLESKNINKMKGPFMVISASGMMTGGRVVHHLRHTITDKRNAIFITGYQAEGTLGRKLLEGMKRVDLYGDPFSVRAEVVLFNEFSAHADGPQLQQYAERMHGLKQALLVHGEPAQADELKMAMQKQHPEWSVDRPKEGETIELV